MSQKGLEPITKADLDASIRMLRQEILGAGGGVSDHGALSGLDDDDHSTIYYNKSIVDNMVYRKIFQSLSDDSYLSFTPNTNSGIIFVQGKYAFIKEWWGYFSFFTGATPYCEKRNGYANMDTTTGALNGTTGIDGHITVSANGGDGKIYVENRRGGNTGILIFVLCG